ncbi:hypothetical protein JYB64_18165 [Algoriphagus aestuarii]|nr:hypothetical protein [Algoriphagus aestuarii]
MLIIKLLSFYFYNDKVREVGKFVEKEDLMELAASLLLILIVYFLGCLALIQEVIKPYKTVLNQGPQTKQISTNYSKILLISFSISLVTTSVAYFLFFV